MKKYLWLFAAILICSTMLTSCGSDDDITPNNPKPVEPTEPVQPVVYNTLKEALEHISTIDSIKKDDSIPDYAESYQVFFRQPIDHQNPDSKSFKQLVEIRFVGFDAPTVVCTCGYGYECNDGLAKSMNANFIIVEHRYFGSSKVEGDPQWTWLTLKQAVDDLHAVVTALKPLLKGTWVSTGVSKSGTTSIYYRYFYPDDVDGTVAFCAPILTSNADSRPMSYLLRESGKTATGDARNMRMNQQIAYMLKDGEDGFYRTCCKYLKENEDYDDDDLPTFTGYAYAVFMAYYILFQYTSIDDWDKYLPKEGASDKQLCAFVAESIPSMDDKDIDPLGLYPYFIQQVKEFGRETILTDESKVWLENTSFNVMEVMTMNLKETDKWLVNSYDNTVNMNILNEFLPTTTCPIMLVYSKNDPWTGAMPKGLNNPHVLTVINPVGTHDECLKKEESTYDEATAQAIKAFVDGLKK